MAVQESDEDVRMLRRNVEFFITRHVDQTVAIMVWGTIACGRLVFL